MFVGIFSRWFGIRYRYRYFKIPRYSVSIGISDVNLLIYGHLGISASAITVRHIMANTTVLVQYAWSRISSVFCITNLKLKFPHSIIMLFLSLLRSTSKDIGHRTTRKLESGSPK